MDSIANIFVNLIMIMTLMIMTTTKLEAQKAEPVSLTWYKLSSVVLLMSNWTKNSKLSKS